MKITVLTALMVFLAYFLVLYEPRWKTKEMGAYARFARRLRGEKQ